MDYARGGSVSSSSSSSSSLKQRIRSSNCFSCCFRGGVDVDSAGGGGGGGPPPSLLRSSSVWIRSKAQELPELKERCRSLLSRIGKPRGRHGSGDFRYDPLSYSLNFDEGADLDEDDEADAAESRYRNFSSRLPATPPQPAAAKGVACN